MKKGIILYPVILFALLGLFVLGCDTQDKGLKATQNVVIDLMAGEVRVSFDEGKTWLPAEEGMQLSEGALIRTGDGAYCDLVLPGRGIFRVSFNTVLSIKSLTEKVQTLTVSRGQLFVNITERLRDDEDFRVETETAVLAVRGTVFNIDFDGETTRASVKNGSVRVVENVLSDLDLLEIIGIDIPENQEINITKENRDHCEEAIRGKRDPREIKAAVDAARERGNLRPQRQKELTPQERRMYQQIEMQERLDKIFKRLEQERIEAEKKAAEERKKTEERLDEIMEKHDTGARKFVDPDKKTTVQEDVDDRVADKAIEEMRERTGMGADASKYIDEDETVSDEEALDSLMQKRGTGGRTTGQPARGGGLLDQMKEDSE
jgi:hypothetical protein